MKKVLFSAFSILLLGASVALLATSSQAKPVSADVSECCCQYETYDYKKDGTKTFRAYCYSWTTPESCKNRPGGTVVYKPKDECSCTVPR